MDPWSVVLYADEKKVALWDFEFKDGTLKERSFMHAVVVPATTIGVTRARTHIGHILRPKRHLSIPQAPTSTTECLLFQQLTLILNRLADWKAALKRPTSAVRSRLWPPFIINNLART